MEYIIYISNYRDEKEILALLRQFLRSGLADKVDKLYIDKISEQVYYEKDYSKNLNILGERHLDRLLGNPRLGIRFSIKHTEGFFMNTRELSYEIRVAHDEDEKKMAVLREMVVFAIRYNQDSFIETHILDENAFETEIKMNTKDEFGYEVTPFFLLKLNADVNLTNVEQALMHNGFEGFTIYKDPATAEQAIVVYYLSDYTPKETNIEHGALEFIEKYIILKNYDENKRLFKSFRDGFAKIRLAQNERGGNEKDYEGFLQKISLEEKKLGN